MELGDLTGGASDYRSELDRLLASRGFSRTRQLRKLAAWLGERALGGDSRPATEYQAGVEALGKPSDFDPSFDVSVRQLKRRMCAKIDAYYETDGREQLIRFVCGRGFALRIVQVPPRKVTGMPVIAVLPLAGDRDGVLSGWLCHTLSEHPRFRVTSRTLAAQSTMRVLSSEHGVSLIIEGEMHRSDAGFAVTLRLVEASSGHILQTYRSDFSTLAPLVASHAATALASSIAEIEFCPVRAGRREDAESPGNTI